MLATELLVTAASLRFLVVTTMYWCPLCINTVGRVGLNLGEFIIWLNTRVKIIVPSAGFIVCS